MTVATRHQLDVIERERYRNILKTYLLVEDYRQQMQSAFISQN